MGKGKKNPKEDSELKMVYTHGKKRNAIANAVIQEGNGTITINRIPIQNIEPKTLRVKIFEPILILGVDKFKDLLKCILPYMGLMHRIICLKPCLTERLTEKSSAKTSKALPC